MIGEIGEIGEKMGEKMGKKIGEKVGEKMGRIFRYSRERGIG
jgi:hypothetical protein